MKILNLKQGSPDWIEWRQNGIGASDIGVIMGSNSYKTPIALWEEKCGFKKEPFLNSAMKHGIANEPIAREWLNKNKQLNLQPLCIEDEENSEFRASLDGYDAVKRMVREIKCPLSEEVLEKARSKDVPLSYQHQVQWQMTIANSSVGFLDFWDYRTNECFSIPIDKDSKLQKEMKKKAKEFWDKVVCGIAPEATTSDYLDIEDKELETFLDQYKHLCEEEKVTAQQKKELKEKIERFGEGNNFRAYGYTVFKSSPRTSYDLKRMKADGIDIDLYAKKSSSRFYTIKCPKI